MPDCTANDEISNLKQNCITKTGEIINAIKEQKQEAIITGNVCSREINKQLIKYVKEQITESAIKELLQNEVGVISTPCELQIKDNIETDKILLTFRAISLHGTKYNDFEIPIEILYEFEITKRFKHQTLGELLYTLTLLPRQSVDVSVVSRQNHLNVDNPNCLPERLSPMSDHKLFLDLFRNALSETSITKNNAISDCVNNWELNRNISSVNPNYISVGHGSFQTLGASRDAIASLTTYAKSVSRSALLTLKDLTATTIAEVSSVPKPFFKEGRAYESKSRTYTNPNITKSITYKFYKVNDRCELKFNLTSVTFRIMSPDNLCLMPKPPCRTLGIEILPTSVSATSVSLSQRDAANKIVNTAKTLHRGSVRSASQDTCIPRDSSRDSSTTCVNQNVAGDNCTANNRRINLPCEQRLKFVPTFYELDKDFICNARNNILSYLKIVIAETQILDQIHFTIHGFQNDRRGRNQYGMQEKVARRKEQHGNQLARYEFEAPGTVLHNATTIKFSLSSCSFATNLNNDDAGVNIWRQEIDIPRNGFVVKACLDDCVVSENQQYINKLKELDIEAKKLVIQLLLAIVTGAKTIDASLLDLIKSIVAGNVLESICESCTNSGTSNCDSTEKLSSHKLLEILLALKLESASTNNDVVQQLINITRQQSNGQTTGCQTTGCQTNSYQTTGCQTTDQTTDCQTTDCQTTGQTTGQTNCQLGNETNNCQQNNNSNSSQLTFQENLTNNENTNSTNNDQGFSGFRQSDTTYSQPMFNIGPTEGNNN